jgi:predicted 2-oxoglutarate/Fe(II)-dependent dioxygenase YbiX
MPSDQPSGQGSATTPPSPAPSPTQNLAAEPALIAGDPAPIFIAETAEGRPFNLATAAGRYLLVSFIDSTQSPAGMALVAGLREGAAHRQRPDISLLVVSGDRADLALQGGSTPHSTPHATPGLDFVWDKDGAALALYRPALPPPIAAAYAQSPFPISFIFNPNLRIMAFFVAPHGPMQAMQIGEYLKNLPAFPPLRPAPQQAPVLIVPYVFEPALCQRLIAGHQQGESIDSGYMVERDGVTRLVVDHDRKRRRDWVINDDALIALMRKRIVARLVPEIRKVFAFDASAIERFIVACYDAESGGGFFRRHRDNTTPATRHRRFAVSINLNTEEYQGGDLLFPEYGTLTYRPPTGGAAVFSCSLMHEALPVAQGKRYAFLPFLYDSTAQKQRAAYRASMGGRDGLA